MSNLAYIDNDFAKGWVSNQSSMRRGVFVQTVYIDINDDYLHDAILFAQIMYWHEPDTNGNTRLRKEIDGHLWIAKNHNEWYAECRVKERMARKSLERIRDRGLIFYELHGFAAEKTPHIRVNWEVFAQKIQEAQNKTANSTQHDTPIRHNVSVEPALHIDTMCQPIRHNVSANSTQHVEPNTETTTETTTEKEQEPIAPAASLHDVQEKTPDKDIPFAQWGDDDTPTQDDAAVNKKARGLIAVYLKTAKVVKSNAYALYMNDAKTLAEKDITPGHVAAFVKEVQESDWYKSRGLVVSWDKITRDILTWRDAYDKKQQQGTSKQNKQEADSTPSLMTLMANKPEEKAS